MKFELFYSSGGTGGPYASLPDAIRQSVRFLDGCESTSEIEIRADDFRTVIATVNRAGIRMDSDFAIRTWESGLSKLTMWETDIPDHRNNGNFHLGYVFTYDGRLIFTGEEFCSSPMDAIDSDPTVASLLTFLSLRPGDTDKEYFRSYSKEQMDFAIHHGESLGIEALELESRYCRDSDTGKHAALSTGGRDRNGFLPVKCELCGKSGSAFLGNDPSVQSPYRPDCDSVMWE